MQRLCSLFPSLRDAPGARPWNVGQLMAWSFSGALGSGSGHAMRFVLSVWSPQTNYAEYLEDEIAADPSGSGVLWETIQAFRQQLKRDLKEERPGLTPMALELELRKKATEAYQRVGPFDLVAAWSVWDAAHKAAALAWLQAPFWP